MGYADDLAACTCSKKSMDNVLQLVDNHGRTWRYAFNAKKSGILTYGESKSDNKQNYSISGIGIRRKGLNMATCSVIFWSVIAPIATYGCEL